jgi:hypothetical protein
MNGDLVGRVDIKTDRQDSVLRIKGAFAEPDVDKVAVGNALRGELEQIATWLAMTDIEIVAKGNLTPHL